MPVTHGGREAARSNLPIKLMPNTKSQLFHDKNPPTHLPSPRSIIRLAERAETGRITIYPLNSPMTKATEITKAAMAGARVSAALPPR
ncbi:MAG: hypothetical protein C0609_08090 [Deltaproteobacteria bacterium]|nr:MAG: hypothetical protein C0609_08090 [Deltaproteobacteria bacterium]